MRSILGILLALCSMWADTFVLSQEPRTRNQIGFVEGNLYPLHTEDFRIGAYNERFALYIISKPLREFIEGKNLQSTQKIRIIRTQNGFISTRSGVNSHFYYTSNNKTNLYAKIAPKTYALKAVKPDILVIENFSKDIMETPCALVRSNVFIRNASGAEIILDWNKSYERDSQNIVFSLECKKKAQEEL
ncbi:hypothetical protein [uncultured Helicobacter sp.]|uniref:hypothetical protein n=1 Tax=uncultured Helicobacter sp. TaxID=175537 RepID=UPI001C3AD47C|nr:hypothetical protein [Candidatus Helicobacter avicola]